MPQRKKRKVSSAVLLVVLVTVGVVLLVVLASIQDSGLLRAQLGGNTWGGSLGGGTSTWSGWGGSSYTAVSTVKKPLPTPSRNPRGACYVKGQCANRATKSQCRRADSAGQGRWCWNYNMGCYRGEYRRVFASNVSYNNGVSPFNPGPGVTSAKRRCVAKMMKGICTPPEKRADTICGVQYNYERFHKAGLYYDVACSVVVLCKVNPSPAMPPPSPS